ncbi:phytanoyl-CoA dioxygenase family protein [uncultured Sphingomonas sp.]|uniref:phytanoyl-CoA dioxygenase family protein n=1 Tax=uncultured Sphingomonas sp. TaxID=158754 RepID=UPI0025E971FF|nr:phytanoyl-CoA dioxygenase family protein [uncultured Sphingomonas sp.]
MRTTPLLDIARDGAAHHPAAAIPLLPTLHQLAADLPQERAGLRFHRHPALAGLLAAGPVHAIAVHHLGAQAQPVRAILFDKTPSTNWSLGWHQDRTIAVQACADVPGYGPWSIKQGIQHVEPPFAVTAAMLTLRVHLDDTPADNAPLLIAPGSHRLGRIAEDAIGATVERCGSIACLARAGDVWSYATPILHASAAARGHRRRRVLQVDYAAHALPPPLEWLGI